MGDIGVQEDFGLVKCVIALVKKIQLYLAVGMGDIVKIPCLGGMALVALKCV